MEMNKRLRQALENQHLTVSKLSELSGVPRKTIYHWLNGQRPRNVEQLLNVCKALKISVESLYNSEIISKTDEKTLFNESLKGDLHAGIYEVILRPVQKAPSS